MKLLQAITIGFVFLITSDVVSARQHVSHFTAHHSAYHHPGWGHGHGYYWGFGFYGAAWPWFYPGYYGYVIPVLPDSLYSNTTGEVDYIQMNPAPSATDAPSNAWYYCENPQGYYPYVKTCVAGWKQVPAEPIK